MSTPKWVLAHAFFLYIKLICGRGRYVKHVARRFKNGFREGGVAPARKKKAAEK